MANFSSLEILDLTGNDFTGSIPPYIGALSSLKAISLSDVELNGTLPIQGPIPKTFSNLTQLESLDLSYNNLSGEIPSTLIALNFLEIFSGTHNNLSGKVPDFKAQFGTFDKNGYGGNPFLCGPPLEKRCTIALLLPLMANQNQDQAPSSTTSQSNAHRELSPMEDPRSPFFLHHGESPGAILVTQLLTEDNYPNWARAMLMALDAKSKLYILILTGINDALTWLRIVYPHAFARHFHLVNKADLETVLRSELFLNEPDNQVRAAHKILRCDPAQTSFPVLKHVIRARDPRLTQITVVEGGFAFTEGSYIPEGIPLSGSSSSRQVTVAEKGPSKKAREVVELSSSEDEYSVFDLVDQSEDLPGDLGDPHLPEADPSP
ncbi:probable leucine-rich repeat receptor-like protein kinase At1g68400 [Quercus suber]|uniref:probable leucine-rich repeat receptor-like protein kinase At1g68400 n=1 Tax=Quercus suber TaxID=58331 RepID=UPI0032DE3BD2